MNTKYIRVIPRDLFNEAKLLKCIGQLTLFIHDGKGMGINFNHDDEAFEIGLNDEGSLSIRNIDFWIEDYRLIFKTTYNSKRNYPLICETEDNEIDVFDDNGQFTEEFKDTCTNIQTT